MRYSVDSRSSCRHVSRKNQISTGAIASKIGIGISALSGG
jgi:hypothetical protein